MNLHELGPSWRKQNDSQGRLNANGLAGIIRRAERDRWTNRLLGTLGCAVALRVVWLFGRTMMSDPSMLVQTGAALCVLGALALLPMIIRDAWTSRSTVQSPCNYFAQELRRTEKLIASNKSPSLYAVLVLLTIGVGLMAIGGLPTPRAILAIAGALATDIAALWGARIYVRRAEQRRVDFEALLAEFQEEASAT